MSKPKPDLYAAENFVGLNPNQNYILTEKVGKGKIGAVFKAVNKENDTDILACKVILEEKLKQGWDQELKKLAQLRGIPNIVPYSTHGTSTNNGGQKFVFILFDFIDGWNLNEYISLESTLMDISFIEQIGDVLLKVLFACESINIYHGDLHEGNIMIRKPDIRVPNSPKTIWVTDFGYGGSHNNVEPKNDRKQICSIVANLLKKIDQSALNPRDKLVYEKIHFFLHKKILESEMTQQRYTGDLASLIAEYANIGNEANQELKSKEGGNFNQSPGDYLWAEAIGLRSSEWKILFVPEFLGHSDLLSKNITVLTGARGCGKTMIFRRLTSYMDEIIGSTSGVDGADDFIGFYMNCRDLIEAFPWIPSQLNEGSQQQIIHFFHLLWFAEICKTIAAKRTNETNESYQWLNNFVSNIFPSDYMSLPVGGNILAHVKAFIEDRKEKCRLKNFGGSKGFDEWPLARLDFLDILQVELHANVDWVSKKPLFFFLDDYTTPNIPKSVQLILNRIIYKRRSDIFFKISTESSNSFVREIHKGKILELHQDFEFIDVASESLHTNTQSKKEFLNKIFTPRIDRHPELKGKDLDLTAILGNPTFSNNELAAQIRGNGENKSKVYYSGIEVFSGMWASDLRSMIQMFVDMLRETDLKDANAQQLPIKNTTQDRIYRATGGEFMKFMESATNPGSWSKSLSPTSTSIGVKFGIHLNNIVEAFVQVSNYELKVSPLVKNQEREHPKQAFRIEILDKFDLPNSVESYYEGLIRWHVFLQDWRGKSVRGMITPRLFLNRLLIPHSNLTFSTHDNIQLKNDEFVKLLETPKAFFNYWKTKRKKKEKENSQTSTLFDEVPE